MPCYDVVIKNGLIFDGTRVPRYRGDLAVRDGVIAAAGRIPEQDAVRVIDAEVLPSKIVHDLPGGGWRRVQRARGYRYVPVNGGVTMEDDRETNTFSGRLLCNGGGARASDLGAVAAQ
jgi:N-acyl-D-aspartate/D-glutamate deacylase